MKLKLAFTTLMIGALMLGSCKKFLETKSNDSLATPETLADLEAILNNSSINTGTAMLHGMSDEYFLTFNDWQSLPAFYKDAHVWDAQLNNYNDWVSQYHAVLNANTVLFNLDLIAKGYTAEKARQDRIRGAALVYRSFAFYRVLQLYALQYDESSAATELGIPLRMLADINDISSRAKMKESYEQIITDLEAALTLLPDVNPLSIVTKTFPTRTAAHALLARTYLQMGKYADALSSANDALALHDDLMDFNDINWVDTNALGSFKRDNPEILLYSLSNAAPNSFPMAYIHPELYALYEDNDLRKAAYFVKNGDTTYGFRGSYTGNTWELFSGLATDELYLIKAECLARAGNAAEAMQVLNELLRTRWRSENGVSTYVDKVAADADEALAIIVTERRKELVNREIRWADLKRLNKEPAFATTLRRDMEGQVFTLAPNDLRYALLIPREVLVVKDLPQNAR